MGNLIRHLRRERGQMLIVSALLTTALLGFIGLIADLGLFYAERRHVQGAADQAATAAALELLYGGGTSAARTAALQNAAGNGFANSGSNTVTVNVPPTSGAHAGDPAYVEVVVTEQPPTFFAHVLVSDGGSVQARGVAGITDDDEDYALLLLNQSECRSLDVSGSGALIVNNGGIMVDSNCPSEAFRKTGSSAVIADVIDVVGGYNGPLSSCPVADPTDPPNDIVCPHPRTGRPAVADPLAGLAPPDLNALGMSPDSGGTPANPQKKHISNGDYTFHPGVYYGGIQLSTNGDITFEPGYYVMAGGGLDISSSGTIYASGVMFYNTYDPQSPNSSDGRCEEMHVSGSTDTGSTITGPASGPYKDIVFWQAANCVDNNGRGLRLHHSGSGNLLTSGVVYMPTGWMHITGSGATGALQIIVDHVDKSGSSDVIIDYVNYVDAPIPIAALVE